MDRAQPTAPLLLLTLNICDPHSTMKEMAWLSLGEITCNSSGGIYNPQKYRMKPFIYQQVVRIQCERTQILNMRALTFLGQSRHGANTVPSDWAVIMFSDILDTLCNMSIRHSRRRQLVGGRARNSSCSPFICLLRAFVFSVSNTTCDIISEDGKK